MIVYMTNMVYEIDFTDQLKSLDSVNFIYNVAELLASKKRLCWLAGGAVRDLWLSRIPQDIDLVTDALDEEILELFPQAVLVGQKFGVYKLPFYLNDRNIIIDLTVFREEDNYVDGRRPQSITRSTPSQDAKRRDFTVNALFYDLQNHQIHDYVGGVEDLQNKILKCVGDAERRFNEDHLRLLRLARFKAQFGFLVPTEDLTMALKLSVLIQTVSGERVYEEILKIVRSHHSIEFWSQELVQKLWFNLGAQINTDQISKLNFLKETALAANQHLVISVVVLWDYASEALDFLKLRLKCSKEEALLAKKTIEYITEIKNKSALDLALLIDKDRDSTLLFQILEFFAKAGECEQLYVSEVKEYLNLHTKPLLTGANLVGKCDPNRIQMALQMIRRAQFEKKIKTSDEAFIFLKTNKIMI